MVFWNLFYNFNREYLECIKMISKWSSEDRERSLNYLKKSGKIGWILDLKNVTPEFFVYWILSLGWCDVKGKTQKLIKQGEEKQ